MMKRVVLAFIATLLLSGCYARVGPPRHRRVVAPQRVVVPLPPRVIVVP